MKDKAQIFPQLLCLATTSTQCDFPHTHPWTLTTASPYPLSLRILSSSGGKGGIMADSLSCRWERIVHCR